MNNSPFHSVHIYIWGCWPKWIILYFILCIYIIYIYIYRWRCWPKIWMIHGVWQGKEIIHIWSTHSSNGHPEAGCDMTYIYIYIYIYIRPSFATGSNQLHKLLKKNVRLSMNFSFSNAFLKVPWYRFFLLAKFSVVFIFSPVYAEILSYISLHIIKKSICEYNI